MNNLGFTPSTVSNNFFVDNVAPSKRGKAFSIKDMYGPRGYRFHQPTSQCPNTFDSSRRIRLQGRVCGS